MKKPVFKKRYVLGVGEPYFVRDLTLMNKKGRAIRFVGKGIIPPKHDALHEKYRLVLERVR